MATKLMVCQSHSCHGQGSAGLLRDIEELVGNRCHVEHSFCLHHCGQGPNIEVTSGDGNSRVVTGIKSFEKMKNLLRNEIGLEPKTLILRVAGLKYKARRIEGEEAKERKQRLALVEQAFKALGGQEKAVKDKPKQASQLLVMRALDTEDAEAALEDAELALELAPKFVQAQLVASSRLSELGYLEEALLAAQTALDNSKSFEEKKVIKRRTWDLQQRLEKKKKSAAPNKRASKTEDVPVLTWSAAPEIEGMAGTKNPNLHTLLKRIGSKAQDAEAQVASDPLVELVYGVYDLMRADRVLGPKFEVFARNAATFERLKRRTVDYLNAEWGATPYQGPDLFAAHASLYVDAPMYDGMMRMWKIMLEKMEVAEQEKSEILQSIEDMRQPICDPDGKFKEEMNKMLVKAQEEREQKVRRDVIVKKKAREELEERAMASRENRRLLKSQKQSPSTEPEAAKIVEEESTAEGSTEALADGAVKTQADANAATHRPPVADASAPAGGSGETESREVDPEPASTAGAQHQERVRANEKVPGAEHQELVRAIELMDEVDEAKATSCQQIACAVM